MTRDAEGVLLVVDARAVGYVASNQLRCKPSGIAEISTTPMDV